MVMVREVLDCLGQGALGRLAEIRDVATARELSERRRILAHSYRGDVSALLDDLRREDFLALLEGGIDMDGTAYSVPGLFRMSVDELRELATKLLVNNVKPRSLKPFSAGRNVLKIRAQEDDVEMRVTQTLSTRHAKGSMASLELGALRERLEGARAIDIASAYYDPDFIESLLVPISRENFELVVRMVFNGLGGSRLKEQINELRALQSKLHRYKGLRKLQIRLRFEEGIFHPKLILIERKGLTALVGSANATMAAMTVNEELMLEVRGADLLRDYFDRVWDGAEPIGAIKEPRATSLVTFFRTGTLFFKPTTQLQLSYNPFSRLLADLTEEDKRALESRRVPIPNAEPETGIGPYSIRRALHLEDLSEDAETREKEPGAKNPSVRTYSIETCLGYWVPASLQQGFEEKLRNAESSKKEGLQLFAEALSAKSDQFFMDGFNAYQKAVKENFEQARIELARYRQSTEADPFTDTSGFKNFLRNIRARLADPDYVDRLCRPFVSAPMPEIWDDPVARRDFTKSFFDYLEFVANKPGNGHLVTSLIQKRCEYSSDDNAAHIQKLMEEFLRSHGWSEADWSSRVQDDGA